VGSEIWGTGDPSPTNKIRKIQTVVEDVGDADALSIIVFYS